MGLLRIVLDIASFIQDKLQIPITEISRYHKKLWMSEVSYGGGMWNPDAMDKGYFQLSRDIQKDLYEINENDYIIDVSDTNFVAAVSPQGDIVIVVTNEGEDAKEYQIDFPNVGEIISISGTRTSETEKWDVIDEEVHYGMGWIECTAAPRSVSTF